VEGVAKAVKVGEEYAGRAGRRYKLGAVFILVGGPSVLCDASELG
jgi:hypothetical protein